MARAQFDIGGDGRHDGGDRAGGVLTLRGDWTATELGDAPRRLPDRLRGAEVGALDLNDMGRFDTAGALALIQAGVHLPEEAWSDRPEAGRVYAMVEKLERDQAPAPKRSAWIVRAFGRVGRGIEDIWAEMVLSMAFLGRLLIAVGRAIVNPRKVRWPAWVSHIERAGLDAMPIVAVTSFFIGAVIAFLGADLLSQFGAGVFAVQLIGVAVLREFAVVITAVLLAGRSASSFAAEIGSMRMNQEVDAMNVMGVDPFQALVIPRLAALLIMLPLLTFVAMMAGLFGGMLVTWSQLNIGPVFFIQRIYDDGFMFTHLMVGLIKAPVFALVVAAIGCRQGMAVAGDVESLGRRVTAAVVQAIFAIIFLDAVFALIFLEIGI